MADSLARHPPRRLGEILVDQGAIDRARLEEVLAAQRRTSLRLGELLVARSMVTRGQVSEALAAQWSLGHVDLRAAPPDPALLEGCDPAACLAAQCIPWRRVGGNILVALADPDRKEAALAATGLPSDGIAFAMADKAEIREAIAQAFREKLRDRALIRTPAPHSCRDWGRFSAPLGIGLAGFLGAFLVAAGPFALATLMLGWAILANCATTLLRLAALAISCLPGAAPPPEDLPRLARFRRLPVVSILVPLYRETAVIDPLLAALARLDYPRELLDIILVLEEDDAPMLDALAVRTLPPSVRTLAVPADRLRTKPRAMNYALDFADGEIIGVYDAEDRPAPDQVTRIVEMFAESPPKVACVQARLGFYNAGQNWLARCFAIEYATWFEILLRGYDRLGLPIPLGGTSVFFRRAALEAVGVWDAYNVTEDADLGMRLARFGYVTRVIDSTTLEEANCRARPWIRQRSRWLKGYMATWITHMRRPRQLWRELGVRGFLGFQVILLGGATAYLALPLLWLGWGMGALGLTPPWVAGLSEPVLAYFWNSLMFGQVVLVATSWRALARTGQRRLMPWILVLPFYWALGAAAAYKAVWELVVAPFHWHKTQHGLSADHGPAEAAAPGEAPPLQAAARQGPFPAPRRAAARVGAMVRAARARVR